MTRGEIYTAAARGPYIGKPRPVVILQDDRFDATALEPVEDQGPVRQTRQPVVSRKKGQLVLASLELLIGALAL